MTFLKLNQEQDDEGILSPSLLGPNLAIQQSDFSCDGLQGNLIDNDTTFYNCAGIDGLSEHNGIGNNYFDSI
jgi:hypothetical protein